MPPLCPPFPTWPLSQHPRTTSPGGIFLLNTRSARRHVVMILFDGRTIKQEEEKIERSPIKRPINCVVCRSICCSSSFQRRRRSRCCMNANDAAVPEAVDNGGGRFKMHCNRNCIRYEKWKKKQNSRPQWPSVLVLNWKQKKIMMYSYWFKVVLRGRKKDLVLIQ